MRKNNPDNSKRQNWLNFLRNHTKYIVGIDLLVERTIYLKTIYVFIAIYHLKRIRPYTDRFKVMDKLSAVTFSADYIISIFALCK